MYNHIGVVVDGRAEEEFFRASLPGCRIRRSICNGRDVPLDRIAREIIISNETFSGDVRMVIAKIDREQRVESRAQIFRTVSALVLERIAPRRLILTVADRCLENWILADEVQMQLKSGLADYSYEYEGRQGKPILRSVLGSTDLPYVQTARLLLASDSSLIQQRSESFAHFSSEVDFPWHWMNGRELIDEQIA